MTHPSRIDAAAPPRAQRRETGGPGLTGPFREDGGLPGHMSMQRSLGTRRSTRGGGGWGGWTFGLQVARGKEDRRKGRGRWGFGCGVRERRPMVGTSCTNSRRHRCLKEFRRVPSGGGERFEAAGLGRRGGGQWRRAAAVAWPSEIKCESWGEDEHFQVTCEQWSGG